MASNRPISDFLKQTAMKRKVSENASDPKPVKANRSLDGEWMACASTEKHQSEERLRDSDDGGSIVNFRNEEHKARPPKLKTKRKYH